MKVLVEIVNLESFREKSLAFFGNIMAKEKQPFFYKHSCRFC